MFSLLLHLCKAWTWKMAWRDSRSKKWKLLLFSSSIIFGIAALVTIGSLRHNLKESVLGESKSLLGADLLLSSRHPFKPETKEWVEQIGGEQSQEIAFNTMASIKGKSRPKLISLRGIESGFPFYGEVKTSPTSAWQDIHTQPGLLVEESFLQAQYAKVGDSLSFNGSTLPIIGVLKESPPSSSQFSNVLPTVIISLPELKKTSLFAGSSFFGLKSMATHRTYFKLLPSDDPDAILKEKEALIAEQRLRTMTVKKRSKMLETAINSLYAFLNIISFSALFLGGIGVAGALHVHIKDRLKNVATLRCLGCTTSQSFAIYLAQGIAMGAIGTLLGLITGSGIVYAAGELLQQFSEALPISIESKVIPYELFKACLIGFSISLGFSLLPLLSVRKVSPLAAIRSDVSESFKDKDPLKWLVYLLLSALAFALAWFDSGDPQDGWKVAIAYTGFIGLAFITLILTGKVLTFILKHLIFSRFPFTLRQGASSLTRPNNQTSLFMVSIGLGVFFIFTLSLLQNILLQWLDPARLENKPNIFIVDLPHKDTKKAKQLISEQGVKVLSHAPIIQLRLSSIKGESIQQLAAKPKGQKVPRWVLNRDFRCSYRTQLSTSEELVSGTWQGEYKATKGSTRIPVSIEAEIARSLKLNIGDPLTAEVHNQDKVLEMEVTSIRTVDWQSMSLNFLLLFPEGAVDDYVAFDVVEAHSPTQETTALLQQQVFTQWPHVNTIDVSLILKTVQSILKTAGSIIQIMALFTVCTGAVVLISTIQSGLKAKTKDSTLLRTLGATKVQIAKMLAIEYALLALIATLAGSLLASLACVLLARFIFAGEPYQFPWRSILVGSGTVILATVILGMLLSRKVTNKPPLAIIREDL